MVCCAVSNCKNTSAKISKNKDGITFHRFPRETDRKRLWEIAVNREEWSATLSSAVCSEHFDTKDFYITPGGLRRLAMEAVPSINISPCQEPVPSISKCLPADIKPTDTEEVKKLKYKVRRLEIIAANRRKKINMLWQGRRRLKQKLKKFKCIIKHLIKHKQDKDKY